MHAYSDGHVIRLCSDDKVIIEHNGVSLEFNKINKPSFDNGAGETVVEYTGLSVDGNQMQSWANASYNPEACSQLHYHQQRTEDYYIISGHATVMLDGEEHHLSPGKHIRILPQQQHQVINESKHEKLNLIVKCAPAWIQEDFHPVKSKELTARYSKRM